MGGSIVKQASRGVVAVVVGLLAGTAHADTVHLLGGTSIEGKASRHGDKVVIEIEAGEIAVSVDEVERIDAGSSVVQRFEAMRAKVSERDLRGLISLANFCRDNEMKDRERVLLMRVVELAPDHGEARARLGYVRSDAGWVKREEHARQQALVMHDVRSIQREQADVAPAAPRPRASAKRAADKPAAPGADDMTALATDPLVHVR